MDHLAITALGIGHGDAILLEWAHGGWRWTCLVDGGMSPRRLLARLEEHRIKTIDLLVFSHLDIDHIGGLCGLTKKVRVREFWGPALPAYQRHEWLFGSAVRNAIARGQELEEELREAGASIIYPLEGFMSAPLADGGQMTVLSPPSRLIRHLLTQDDICALVSGSGIALGWLLAPEGPLPEEQTAFLTRLDRALARCSLTPGDLSDAPQARRPPEVDPERLAQQWSETTGVEPEFFGDDLMNNSSIVVYLNAQTDNRRHRVLLAGDQENWTYLLAQHPHGLRADVLKAAHHGGQMYVEADESVDEVLSSVLPAVVLVSASGLHSLPRLQTRNVAAKWGATIACTCRRTIEYVTGSPEGKSCHEVYSCDKETKDVTITMDTAGIRSSRPACHTGYGRQPGPPIEVRQHIVEPSPVLGQLFENELRKHIAWVKARLVAMHKENTSRVAPMSVGRRPISEDDLASMARQEGRNVIVPHLPEILRAGMHRGQFWAAPREQWQQRDWHAYALPDETEIKTLLDRLADKAMLLFPKGPDPSRRDVDSIVNGLETSGLVAFADAILHLPEAMFRDSVWPHVATKLKSRSWHCYLHGSGSVAFSVKSSECQLYQVLLAALVQKNNWNDKWGLQLPQESFPFEAPVIVSGKDDKTGKELGTYAQSDAVRRWMSIKKRDLAEVNWEQLVESFPKAVKAGTSYSYSDSHYMEIADLVEALNGDSNMAANWAAKAVKKLW